MGNNRHKTTGRVYLTGRRDALMLPSDWSRRQSFSLDGSSSRLDCVHEANLTEAHARIQLCRLWDVVLRCEGPQQWRSQTYGGQNWHRWSKLMIQPRRQALLTHLSGFTSAVMDRLKVSPLFSALKNACASPRTWKAVVPVSDSGNGWCGPWPSPCLRPSTVPRCARTWH